MCGEWKGKLDAYNISDGFKRKKSIQRRKKEGAVRQKSIPDTSLKSKEDGLKKFVVVI